MLVDLAARGDGIAVLQLNGRVLRSDMLGPLGDMCTRLHAQGKSGVILDLSRAGRISSCGLAVLVELMAIFPHLTIGYCAMPRAALRHLERLGLERAMPLYSGIDQALVSPAFQRCRHQGVQVILNCRGGDTDPHFPAEVPPWALDVVGKPLIHHSVDYLARAGVRHVVVAEGGQSRSLPALAQAMSASAPGLGISLMSGLGDAESVFGALCRQRNMSVREVVICPGNMVLDFDLAPLLEAHRQAGASLTQIRLRGRGSAMVSVFHQGDADDLERAPQVIDPTSANGMCGLGGRLIGSWQDYFGLIERILCADQRSIAPLGKQIREGVWLHPEANVSARARIGRACYVGAGAQVQGGATVTGVSAIGAQAVLHRHSLARNSLILSGTELCRGALADGVVACGDWAVCHRTSPDRGSKRLPLDYVKWADRASPTQLGQMA